MAGESQETPGSAADPSVMSQEAITREGRRQDDLRVAVLSLVKAELAVRDERLDAIDKATIVFNETLTRVPTEVQKEIGHIRELVFERLESVRRLDIVREEHRLELKADAEKALSTAREADQKAVAAALAAAEKARDQQTIASQLATNKAETAFTDALAKQQDTFTLAIANVVSGQNDTKGRLTTIEQRLLSQAENSTSNRADSTLNINLVMVILVFVSVGIAAVVAFTR